MSSTIVVTEKEFEKGKDVFAAAADVRCVAVSNDEPTLAAAVREHGAKAVIVGVEKYTGELYQALTGGVIARFGVGYDGIDLNLCKQHGIVLTNTPGVLDRSVAEHAIWLMGALARRVAEADRTMREGTFGVAGGEELFGKTLVLAGFGRIARLVAHIAGEGLGMRVLACDVLTLEQQAELSKCNGADFLEEHRLAGYTCDWEDVLPHADVVSIHMPSNETTHHYFNARRLGLMRQGSVLINTARGPIVDEVALYDALASGSLGGAALDVFEREPYAPVDPSRDLRKLPNVVLTPHIGSNTKQSNRRMAEASLANCAAFVAGEMGKLTRVN